MTTPASIARTFIDQIYRKANYDTVDDLVADRFYFAGSAGHEENDKAALKQRFETLHATVSSAFPDMEYVIEETIAEGNSVAVRLTQRGTMTGPYQLGPTTIEPTGERVELTAVEVFHVVDGKITKRWAARDRLGLFQQLGIPLAIG